ncbi:probable cytochrome P450 12d1 proximal, mitochondrial [Physella acuta]|uniref:probable cytochrome P450 12d1 proximal, mitochondrial n=1 Tax=Physella acuta TaxID=109671 RepID=UPI0027DC9A25|nr:probable cytochrome P450 12d1 proximal, mitochondrial [Physella acuta]
MSPNPDEDTKTFLQASQDIFNTMNKSMNGESIAHTWYKNKTYREFERASGIITKNSAKHAAQARKVIEEQTKAGTLNPDEPNLLLSLSAEKGLDFDQVAMIIDTLYVAGTDSTAKNLQTLFYNLATNPDKQEKLRQEIHDVIGHDGPVTPQAISEMTYLKACLKESFRLHPPTVGVTMRILPTDVVLSGYRVPSGVPVILGNTTAGKMYFDNPQQYNPERWLRSSDGRKQENIPSSAVLPFGHGPRNCVGQRFAVQEIYLAASKVLQKLKIELERESWNTEFIYKVFITPKQPLKFRFTKLVG